MRLLALALLLATPLAAADLCAAGACVADDEYRAPPPCQGTWAITGAWLVAPGIYAYAAGERRECRRPWGDQGATGLRAGAWTSVALVEARWQRDHIDGRCEIALTSSVLATARACPAAPPALPWGALLA